MDAIHKPKRAKAEILNECIIEGRQTLLPLLLNMFNNILNSGYFSENWSSAIRL